MNSKQETTNHDGDAGSARIIGPKEKYVKIGSSLTLTCNFQVPPSRISPHASRLIVDWLHGEEAFTFGSGRGGVRIENNKDGSDVTSRLTLARVEEGDAGKYTCRPAHGRPATSTVIIVDG
ncbi:hypothetical protein AAG570_003921 [Ranatra chinensis]|uniref:Ig-like domain-containing protein n=1 Tax=Ranatra chinensis TaxID=642074 RepID=A0ABD0Y2D1_9HEMI